MSGEIPRPLGSIALVATLLVSGVGVGAPANIAGADACLTAPNSPAPQGSHWYYRLDWATQHKCWYLRAPGQPAQQAAAPATLARVISVQSVCAGDHRDNGQTCPAKCAGRKYRAINDRGTRSASKHVVAD
jgi:hypothetical protein